MAGHKLPLGGHGHPGPFVVTALISTWRIILVVEGQACDKQIDYFRARRAGIELHKIWILYVIVL